MTTATPFDQLQNRDDHLKHYLADSPPTIVPLSIKPHFEALSDKEKLYAHHISMYDWSKLFW